MAFAAVGDGGGGDLSPDGSSDSSAPSHSPSGVAMQWNAAIAQAASAASIDPAVLKAIVATETGFNPDAINPEKDFILGGVSYNQYDRAAHPPLVASIKDCTEP